MLTFSLRLLTVMATTLAAGSALGQQEQTGAGKPENARVVADAFDGDAKQKNETQSDEETVPNPLRNPGFEASEPGRFDFGWRMGRVSAQQPKEGERSGYLESRSVGPHANLMQSVDATPFRGKRIRYRAAVRIESEQTVDDQREARAQLWFRVDRRSPQGRRRAGAFDNMHDRPITENQWKFYDLIGDVDDDASRVNVGLFMTGKGRAWIDDASIEIVDHDVAITTISREKTAAANEKLQRAVIHNAGFELGNPGAQIGGWQARDLSGYRARISDQEPKLGKQCGVLQRQPGKKGESHFGTLNHLVDAAPFRGKRVRFHAAVRTVVEGEGNEARLWFRVDRSSQDGKISIGAFDNMGDRPITATQWKYYDIVGNVAPDARGVVVGLMLMGHGKAYIDDVLFEVVGNDVEPTAKEFGSVTSSTRPRGTPIGELGPGLFEIIGQMEVLPSSTWPTDGSGEATLLLPLPLSYRDQVPLAYHLWADPPEALKSVAIYEDQPNNFVAKVVLSDLAKHNKVDLEFRSPILVAPSKFDGVPKSVAIPPEWPRESQIWLTSTWCVEAENERIRAIAKEIRDETDDVLQVIDRVERKARSIFRAAEGRLQNLTAVEALDKRGSCTSCGNLVAALLRGCDVPARVLAGYPSWSGPLQTHYIVEAYVPSYGWYPVESTRCQSPWPNSHQINVAIIPPEYEAQNLAGRRRSAAGGVPYLSLTEMDDSGIFFKRGTIEGAPRCDHQCELIRRFEADTAQWTQAMAWAKPRWENWVRSAPSAENGRLSFAATADEIDAKSPQELVDQLNR